jgi:hypothetical protein
MPMNPLQNDLHVDQLLTNVSIGYVNPGYIADRIFPVTPVQKQSNIIPKYVQSFWFRDEALLRAPGTKSQGAGFSVDTTAKYFCERFSYRFEITDEQRDNADLPYNLERDGTLFVTDKLMMRRERAFSASFFTTGVWGADKVGNTDFTKWSNYAGSQPLVDIYTYQDAVEGSIAREANTLVLGKPVWVSLKWHPDLIDTIKYNTTLGKMTPDGLVQLTDLTRILVGRGIFTSTVEGTAEASVVYSRIWGASALLIYVPDSPSLITPAAGYTFVWERVPGAVQYMKSMRDEEREVQILEGNSYFAQAQTAAGAGIFLSQAA